jgi:hypothetical protein
MQLVLLTSERTLLPVVVTAREARTLVERFPLALAPVLAALSLDLAEAPCGRIGMLSPGDLTRELFALPALAQ